MADEQTAKVGTCHACNGTVSKTAKTCPHCGEKSPYRGKDKRPGVWGWLLIIFGFFFLIGQIGQIFVPLEERAKSHNAPSGYGNEAQARQKCETAIRASVNNPSTVSIQSVVGYGSNIGSDGTRRITQTFSAKNSFGLKKTYDAICSIKSDGTFDLKVIEQGR